MTLGGTFIDLGRVRPASALCAAPRRRRWRTLPWEGRLGRAGEGATLGGTMLVAGPETRAPTITVDPGVHGLHEIYVGLAPYGAVGPSALRYRFDDDPGFRVLQNDLFDNEPNAHHTRQAIQDCFLGTEDLTGRRVHFAQFDAGDTPAGVMFAYVRVVPVRGNADTGRRAGVRDGTTGRKRLVGMNDGHGLFYVGVGSEEDLWRAVLPYRDSGYAALHFCITGADHCNYPTKVGTLLGDGLDDYPTAGYRRYTESIKALTARGVDPLASVKRMARSIGLEFHVSVRMEAFAMEPPYDGFFMSRFYAAHPELRCVDRDGRAIARLSYAFPEVREHLYAIIDEIARYEPDGISFIFPRAQPFVLYEEPFLRRFRQLHGTDPRRLPEDHPDVLALRARVMNDFMRGARERTGPEGSNSANAAHRRTGRPLELSALVLSDERSNELYGLDVLRWARERWVDELSPTVWDYRRWRVEPEMAYLVDTCRGSGCRIVVNLHPSEIANEQFIATARGYHEQGADGFSIWDGDPTRSVKWGLYRAIGDVATLEGPPGAVPASPTLITLTRLGDFVMDRYKSSWCF